MPSCCARSSCDLPVWVSVQFFFLLSKVAGYAVSKCFHVYGTTTCLPESLHNRITCVPVISRQANPRESSHSYQETPSFYRWVVVAVWHPDRGCYTKRASCMLAHCLPGNEGGTVLNKSNVKLSSVSGAATPPLFLAHFYLSVSRTDSNSEFSRKNLRSPSA